MTAVLGLAVLGALLAASAVIRWRRSRRLRSLRSLREDLRRMPGLRLVPGPPQRRVRPGRRR